MLWFLRWFPQFRDLESLAAMQAETAERCSSFQERCSSLEHDVDSLREANQELTHEKILLQDRLDSAIQDKDRIWESMQTALQGERYALQTMVNHAVQKNGGGVPFGEAHVLPATEIRKPQAPGGIGRSARALPSEIAQRATNTFVKNYMETLGPTEKVG